MDKQSQLHDFIQNYNETVVHRMLKLRQLIISIFPEITEQLDMPARMIAYCYGQKNADLICVLIPSKKGIKLGFNRGVMLNDPHRLLKGSGKISRYVEINSNEIIDSIEIKNLLLESLSLYKNQLIKS